MSITNRTNSAILKTVHALEWLGNQSPGKTAKAAQYNALQLRVQLHVEAYKSLAAAIGRTQKALFARFEAASGDEIRYLENGNVSFGIMPDREYIRQSEALMDASFDEEPARRAFVITDFEAVGIMVPQLILDELGPLFTKPADFDPDAITGDADADADEDAG